MATSFAPSTTARTASGSTTPLRPASTVITSAPRSRIRRKGRRTELCSMEQVMTRSPGRISPKMARFSASVALVQKAIRSGASALISLARAARGAEDHLRRLNRHLVARSARIRAVLIERL